MFILVRSITLASISKLNIEERELSLFIFTEDLITDYCWDLRRKSIFGFNIKHYTVEFVFR